VSGATLDEVGSEVCVVSDQGDHARPTLPRLEHGSVFAGYWIDRLLDRGGMGVVYKAMDVDLDRAVALKLIAPEWMEDDNATARFRTEARLAASLEHPNIVPVHRGGEEQGVLYLAMRFVPGTNLRRMIDRSPLAFETTGAILTQIASALDAAHARGLVHRDVKPANILISDETAQTHAYLTDFGLTKRPGSTGGLTGTGLWVGTADYVAPEQIQGHTIDGRADVYSLGCVLYEMLTGEVAYPKDGDIAKLWAHISNPPPQPSATRPDLVPAFDDVVARATAKDPADRYATAGEMAAAAREAIALQHQAQSAGAVPPSIGLGAAAPPAPTPPPTPVPAAPESWAGTPPSTPASTPSSGASMPPFAQSTQAPAQPAAPPPAAPPPAAPPPSRSAPGGRSIAVIALVALGALAVAAVLLVTSGGKDKNPSAASAGNKPTPAEPAGDRLKGTLGPVPMNHVSGAGDIAMRLDGTTLTVTVAAHGLVDGKHAMHIHAGARGVCPPASAAKRHNGHLAISTIDGAPFYGPPVTALTTRGDTSPKSILSFNRFLSGSAVRYARKLELTDVVAANIRKDDAVIIVHGIDYDHDGAYGNVLDRSDLDRSLPGEITAPALCGQIVAAPPSSTSSDPTKTGQVPGHSGKGTFYVASLQPEPTAIAALCYLGAHEEGDRTRPWDA
jgi:serine/threonine protein kinase